MTDYIDYEGFKKYDRELRERGSIVVDELVNHCYKALGFFHAGGNYQINIVNDILDTASAMRFPRKTVGTWLQVMCGHELKGTGQGLCFGKRKVDLEYSDVLDGIVQHIKDFPDWRGFKPEEEELPLDEILAKLTKQIRKKLDSAQALCKENGLFGAEAVFEGLVNEFSVLSASEAYKMVQAAPDLVDDVPVATVGDAEALDNSLIEELKDSYK